MNIPKGQPLLVCSCGWPLFVAHRQSHQKQVAYTFSKIYETSTYEAFVWHADGLMLHQNDPQKGWFQHVTGYCKSCHAPFNILLKRDIAGGLDGDEFPNLCLVGDLLLFTPHVKMPGIPTLVRIDDFEPKAPFKIRFTSAVYRALTAGLSIADLPMWNPQGSQQQFKAWQRELDSKVAETGRCAACLPKHDVFVYIKDRQQPRITTFIVDHEKKQAGNAEYDFKLGKWFFPDAESREAYQGYALLEDHTLFLAKLSKEWSDNPERKRHATSLLLNHGKRV